MVKIPAKTSFGNKNKSFLRGEGKKSAMLSTTLNRINGGDKVNYELAEEYSRKGYRVDIYTFESNIGKNNENIRIIELFNPKNVSLKAVYRLLFPLNVFEVIRITRRMKNYDEVFSMGYPMTLISCLAKIFLKKKYNAIEHGDPESKYQYSYLYKSYTNIHHYLHKLTLKNVDKVITVSAFQKNELKRKFNIDAEINENGSVINRKKFKKLYNKRNPPQKNLKEISKKYGVKRPTLLAVGRITSNKGTHILLKSFNEVRKTFPKARLIVVGQRSEYKKYDNYINSLPQKNVRFTGWIDEEDLIALYHLCDLYVSASLYESYNLAIDEAQSCGLKVVCFDIGAHREVLRDKRGLVPVVDYKAFSDRIIKFLS